MVHAFKIKNLPAFFTGCIFLMLQVSMVQAQVLPVAEEKKNSFSIFGSAEYGLDTRSGPPSSMGFRDGFFHSAGFYYRRTFAAKWYVLPGICYTQIVWTNRAVPAVTEKIHRIGVSFYAGYYVFKKENWSIGIGGGLQALYNAAGVTWEGKEITIFTLSENDIYTFGLEVNLHAVFNWRVHKNWEVYASPFVQENVLPVFRVNPDNAFRTGITLGAGYLF